MVKFSGNYYAIASNVSLESEYYALYCNSKDQPYVAVDDRSVTNVDFDYIYNDNSTDNTVDNSQHLTVEDMKILDITNNTMNLIDDKGQTTNYTIESLYYDASSKSYTANVYNTVFNTTNNYYEYNYYTYNISYTYNNTYVTYIGSNADYQEPYEYYYELPDGRSSADLTAEDVAGLSFQFYDVVNYQKSATDNHLRALYHFDGDTDDSSFFSTQTAFTWNKGASITYMDSNAFNGCLYLDEQEHDFTVTLPSNIGSGDFTLQWRYYQNSATTTEHNENYVMFGNTKLLGWSEKNLYRMGTTQMYPLSLGTWQELALVRYNGVLYFYHNGLKVGSLSNASVFEDTFTFHLGASSRGYSMLDEMRFVNFAVAEGTSAYTCTSVPYDTNGVLVLPGGAIPIADEYWKWDTTIKPTYSVDMTTGFLNVLSSSSSGSNYSNWNSLTKNGFYTLLDTVSAYDGFTTLQGRGANGSSQMSFGTLWDYDNKRQTETLGIDGTGVGIYLGSSTCTAASGGPVVGDYTFNLLCRDGSSYSMTCTIPDDFTGFSFSKSFDWGTMAYYRCKGSSKSEKYALDGIFFDITSGKSLDVVYLEAVPGTTPNTGHELVTCAYSPDELQANTAAVQSDIPVKGYTVGGVRPTFPVRGDVWFSVEGSRISGVQIYNGRAWEQTNARWWTGKRWIPIYAFDLITLEDMWDVAGEDGGEVIPPITSDYGFWNWWKGQWLDFRSWLASNSGGSGGGPIIFPPISDCEHTYTEKVLTAPTCTMKGSALYTCSKCGDSYTDTLNANGHDWLMKESIPDELGEGGAVLVAGYDLYVCSVCGEEYKDYARTGPPGEEGGSTLTQLIQQLFESLGGLVGSLIDWVLELAVDAVKGFGDLGDYFKEKAGEIEGFGGEFIGFLGAFFTIIPPEIMTCLSLTLVLLGLTLFIRKVLLS